MKIIALFIALLVTLGGSAQTDSARSVQADTAVKVIPDISTSIVPGSNKLMISRAQLDSGFTIHLSDPRARVVSFDMTYFFTAPGKTPQEGVAFVNIPGNRVYIDKTYPPASDGTIVTLTKVIFERNGKRYGAHPLVIYVERKRQ